MFYWTAKVFYKTSVSMFSKNMSEQKVNMIPSLVESVSVKILKYQRKHFKPKS